jgi:nicotinamidase-related amidase
MENDMRTAKFFVSDTLLVLVDYQVSLVEQISSIPQREMLHNVSILTEFANTLHLPVILTTNLETSSGGACIEELKSLLPDEFSVRIKREGIIDVWNDPRFIATIMKSQRTNVILAGLTNDVAVSLPALGLVHDSYNVCVVADAGGSLSTRADSLALRRMADHGVEVVGTNQIVMELASDVAINADRQAQLTNKILYANGRPQTRTTF